MQLIKLCIYYISSRQRCLARIPVIAASESTCVIGWAMSGIGLLGLALGGDLRGATFSEESGSCRRPAYPLVAVAWGTHGAGGGRPPACAWAHGDGRGW